MSFLTTRVDQHNNLRLLGAVVLCASATVRFLGLSSPASGVGAFIVFGAGQVESVVFESIHGSIELALAVCLMLNKTTMIASAFILTLSFCAAVLMSLIPGIGFEYFVLGAPSILTVHFSGLAHLLVWFNAVTAAIRLNHIRTRPGIATLAICTTLVASEEVRGQTPQSPSSDIRHSMVPLSTIDPSVLDDSDLAPLESKLKGVRIVLLSETHRDGASYCVKSRLVKFLHERLGFDVLAWEAPIFDCRQLQAQLRSFEGWREFVTAPGIDQLWTGAGELTSLFDYIIHSQEQSNSLHLIGIDCKLGPMTLSGKSSLRPRDDDGSVTQYICHILTKLQQRPETIEAAARDIDELLKYADDGAYLSAPVDARARWLRTLESLLAVVSNSDLTESEELNRDREFAIRLLVSIKALDAWMVDSCKSDATAGASFTNARDRAMFENLCWYADRVFPSKKLIVWTGGIHGIMRPSGIHFSEESDERLPPPLRQASNCASLISLAELLRQRFGSSLYVIGTTSYHGLMATPGVVRELEPAQLGSFESVCNDSGVSCGLVEFRGLPEGHWLLGEVPARMVNQKLATAIWPRVFDGVVFSRSTWRSHSHGESEDGRSTDVGWGDVQRQLNEVDRLSKELPKMTVPSPDGVGELFVGLVSMSQPLISMPLSIPFIKPSGAYVASVPLLEARVFSEPTLFMALDGIARSADVEFQGISALYVSGGLQGNINCLKENVTAVEADAAGSLNFERSAILEVSGRLSGKIVAAAPIVVRLVQGIIPDSDWRIVLRHTGSVVQIGGFVNSDQLSHITGPGRVRLEQSDIESGTHRIRDLEVEVGRDIGDHSKNSKLERCRTWLATWAEIIRDDPDPEIVVQESVRKRISAYGLPWLVRHVATGIEMILVPGTPDGGFTMGCESSEANEQPAHKEVVKEPFYLSRYELSREQWHRVMSGSHLSLEGAKNQPVVGISWDEVMGTGGFCERTGLSLPTEAQWEWAAKGLSSCNYPWGEGISPKFANYYGSHGRPMPVGSYPLGRSWCGCEDMAGNVAEWCYDLYLGDRSSQELNEPVKAPSGVENTARRSLRVVRGGSWGDLATRIRVTSRSTCDQSERVDDLGLRPATTIPKQE